MGIFSSSSQADKRVRLRLASGGQPLRVDLVEIRPFGMGASKRENEQILTAEQARRLGESLKGLVETLRVRPEDLGGLASQY